MNHSPPFDAQIRLVLLSLLLLLAIQPLSSHSQLIAEELTEYGFGKRDITPTLPMRLSGYSNRIEPAKDALEKLHIRTMVLRLPQGELHAVVSIDLLGLGAAQNAEIARRVEAAHKIPRERLVLSCTHTHTGPQLLTPASNLLSTPFTPEETQRATDYAERLVKEIVTGIGDAIQDLKPGKIFLGEGKANVAMNRRKLVNNQWVMVANPEGLVDHSLPVLKITNAQGEIRGLVFNYACHATTLGPNDNQFNPDWPGYAAKFLEEAYPGSKALSLIGCGADANPEPRASGNADAVDLSIGHGRTIANAVQQVLNQPMKEIQSKPVCSFGYAGLAFDLPSAEELKERLNEKNVTIRQHAANMLEILRQKRMLPSTYPLPLQTWQFGNELTMVFMGGEVVVDYALRLKKELTPGAIWVTAYANDDPGYIASERVRSEGGYEVDYSMFFYNQPGRWQTGTEELIIKRIKELRDHPQAERAQTPEEALLMFHLPPEFKMDLVAAEPLVMDPINFAFGPDGKLWVVEMADYPLGQDGKPIGRVVWLEDSDQDGRFDQRHIFLDHLEYPTGVFPFKEGVVVSASPEIFFAKDQDGDGTADHRQTLFSGFGRHNPQHRMNGFAYGLDQRLYLAGGDANHSIHATLLNQDVDLQGSDFSIDPERGNIRPESGKSQYGRSRSDWGDWFGCDNSRPTFQFVIPERSARRNPHVVIPGMITNTWGFGETPPVFPTSRLTERFNELHTANRFTSACSVMVFRDDSLGPTVTNTGFICEPVHNLVQQAEFKKTGITYSTTRISYQENREFLSSTDPWFRPVRVATGPDGALWIADMYRQVIEHPEWIPDHWQTQLDLRAGADRGRIYRISRKEQPLAALPRLSKMDNRALIEQLASRNGTLRDLAQQLLMERKEQGGLGEASVSVLKTIHKQNPHPQVRTQALWTLSGLGELTEDLLQISLVDPEPLVVIQAIRLCAERLALSPETHELLWSLSDHSNLDVRFELALAAGAFDNQDAGKALSVILLRDSEEEWVRSAILTSAVPHAEILLEKLFATEQLSSGQNLLLEPLVATLINSQEEGIARGLQLIVKNDRGPVTREREFAALVAVVNGLERRKQSLSDLRQQKNQSPDFIQQIETLFENARVIAADHQSSLELRQLALRLLGKGISRQSEDLHSLGEFVSPLESRDIQQTAIAALGRFNSENVPEILLKNWKQHSPEAQSSILEILLSRKNWTAALLAAIESQHVPPGSLNPSVRIRLTQNPEQEISSRAAELLTNRMSDTRQKVLETFAPAHELKGDEQRGSNLFKKHCSACHQFRGQGTQIGANLTVLQNRSANALIIAILDPNQAVEGKFRSYSALLKDGRVLNGMIVEESANSLTLASSNGTLQTLLRRDLEELVGNGTSFMPEGFEKDLDLQGVADLVAFLQGSEPLPPQQ